MTNPYLKTAKIALAREIDGLARLIIERCEFVISYLSFFICHWRTSACFFVTKWNSVLREGLAEDHCSDKILESAFVCPSISAWHPLTGRQRGSAQKADIPMDLDPILKRIGIDGRMWVDLVWRFKRYFGRSGAAGSPQSLKESAAQNNRKFARGQRSSAACFVIG